jgi:hypothetical protein
MLLCGIFTIAPVDFNGCGAHCTLELFGILQMNSLIRAKIIGKE